MVIFICICKRGFAIMEERGAACDVARTEGAAMATNESAPTNECVSGFPYIV